MLSHFLNLPTELHIKLPQPIMRRLILTSQKNLELFYNILVYLNLAGGDNAEFVPELIDQKEGELRLLLVFYFLTV